MVKVIVYSAEHCPYCDQAKRLLQKKGVNFEEIRVDLDEKKRAEMMEKSGRRTVPQIFINDQSIGGFDELWALEQQGKLDPLLKSV
ncbi:MAG: glutaredoxin 3 [Coxiella sp. RIFCSPHIGHO2_12_FULL_42_15]|nr:MAG: glutaredoxin 3 [Coxiella sp. RIFCSPHIGHO2_12_FULL_42_15]